MKQKNLFTLVASMMMLGAMTFASCKMSNKPATAEAVQDSVPEAAKYIVGLEKYQTKIDYSKAENWLDVPAAMVKNGVLDGNAADSLKAVDVFYIYPTVTGFRPETEVCDDTPASVKENLGSLTVEGKLVTPGIADARVDTVRGSFIVTTADAKLYAIPADGAAMFGPESYHLHDYGFFFNNLKQNVADRIKAFLEKQ